MQHVIPDYDHIGTTDPGPAPIRVVVSQASRIFPMCETSEYTPSFVCRSEEGREGSQIEIRRLLQP